MIRICVTGATGFLGGYLVKLFKEKDFYVVAFGRNEVVGKKLTDKNVIFIKGHLENQEDVNKAIRNCDYVVHAGALSSVWGDYETFYNSNVQGTIHILEACGNYNVKRFVFISTPSIYTVKQDRFNISEEDFDEKNDLNNYIKTKILAEQTINKWSKGNFEKVIIRPRGLFGIGDTSVIPRLMRLNARVGIPLFNQGENLVDITYVENVAHSIFLASTVDGIDGGIYNITNGEPMRFKTVLAMFLDNIGSKPKFIHMKFNGLFKVVSLIEAVYKSLHIKKEPIFTRYTLLTLGFSQTLNIDKAREELGYEPLFSLKEGIEIYGNWYRGKH